METGRWLFIRWQNGDTGIGPSRASHPLPPLTLNWLASEKDAVKGVVLLHREIPQRVSKTALQGPLSHSGSPASPNAPTHSHPSLGRPLGSADRSLSDGSGGRVASPACWVAGSPLGSWHGHSWASGSPAGHMDRQAGDIKQEYQNWVKDALASGSESGEGGSRRGQWLAGDSCLSDPNQMPPLP